ncbi:MULTISPECIES: GFA family protein [Oxalobacteraceae]|uniref:GFA family protein n=1 Tax=Herminiimonas sp. Marseille-P9896 TaxID=2742211 RepID=UPI00158CA42E|nr:MULTISPECIES: GFA family protein [Oxalobacteraceae]
MEGKRYSGGCLCGHIRFTAHGVAANPHSCSCDNCQRHSGAPSLCWVEFPKDVVEWTGTGGMPSLFRSSDYSSRSFCPRCGSTLGAVDDAPMVALVTGSFDDSDLSELRPVSHSYVDACPAWWTITKAV